MANDYILGSVLQRYITNDRLKNSENMNSNQGVDKFSSEKAKDPFKITQRK